jgi:subtilisin family serine protease/photosystem II stability/assembly factor-like uncharacterized protein
MRLFYSIGVIILFGLSLIAKPLDNYNTNSNNGNLPLQTFVEKGLTILIHGEAMPDGTYKPAKIVKIPKLAPEQYLPNMIHIKTKKNNKVKDGKILSSNKIMAALAPYSVNKIDAPFANINKQGSDYTEKFGVSRIYEVSYSSGVDPYSVCKDLMTNPEIEYAVPVFVRYTDDYTPNDPQMGQQWAINILQMKKAWDISKGSPDIVIGIVDSGVFWTHEDLAANIWTNSKEIPDNNIDDDSNGYVDDYRGWDLIGNWSGSGDFIEDNDPSNVAGNHGTHVAGCAAAVTNNGKGIAGIASNCKIMAVKCGTDRGGSGVYRGYDGIVYAAKMGAHIINCSWGGPGYSPAEQDIINEVTAMGTLIVVAAGNSGANIDDGGQYPACYDNVLCVGATTSSDKKAGFSNYGFPVTVYTPGENIYATMPNNLYQSQSGTSMASPVTSGVAGLVKSLHPEWGPVQILQQIRSTSDNILTTDPAKRQTYYGRTNAYKALNYNNTGSTDFVPGLALESYTLEGTDVLSDYVQKKLNVKVRNYLYNAPNVKMTLIPVGDYLEISQLTFNFGTVPTDGTKEINIDIRLKESNPWYLGTIPILVKFESGTYVNFQYISVPVSIETTNNYTQITEFPEEYPPTWMSADTKDEGNLWAVGNSILIGSRNIFYYSKTGIGNFFNFPGSDQYYNVCAKDNTTAWFGGQTQQGSLGRIAKTTDGGTNWNVIDASAITPFINGIHFFDDKKGIVIGDPITTTSKWGIGVTNDGGTNWAPHSNPPTSQSGEEGWNSVFFGNETNAWFGSNKGRVLRTTDRGLTWGTSTIKDAVNIIGIAFLDNNNGFAIYSKSSSQGAPFYLATTSTGGSTWITDKYDFASKNLKPVKLFALPEAKRVYILCQTGQIFATQYGNTIEPVLTVQQGAVQSGDLISTKLESARMWILGLKMGSLEFRYHSDLAERKFEVTSGSSYEFPQTQLGEYSSMKITLKNSGNVDINVKEFSIVNEIGTDPELFKITGVQLKLFPPGTSKDITVRFTPKEEGVKKATLKILSDADNNNGLILIDLKGEGIAKVGINDINEMNNALSIYPNPANGKAILNFKSKADGFAELSMIDNLGKQIYLGKYNTTTGINNYELDLSKFTTGTYTIKLTINGSIYTTRIVVY